MIKLWSISQNVLTLIIVSVLSPFSAAFAQNALEDFQTETGKCSLTTKAELLDQVEGFQQYSYAKSKAILYQRWGLSPKTDAFIAPLTRLNCLVRSDNKMLVTSAKSDGTFCGWVETGDLLEASASGTSIMGSNLAPCGAIKPISIRDFCSKMDDLDKIVEGCKQGSVGRSVIKTKFITDNTTSQDNDGKRLITEEKIELYASAQSMEKIATVKIFTILEVFDLMRNETTGVVRLLVGIKGSDLKGWINYDTGTIWYSNLSTYFKAAGEKDVFQSEIGVRNNARLATRPQNLQMILNGNKEFPRYPVLYDYREKTVNSPVNSKPHLQIAFIGRFCDGDNTALCSSVSDAKNNINLNSADIMFLIDGTKSMEKYFSLVSKAVRKFTNEYIDDPNYRFGASTYGDFKSTSKRKTTDPMDFKIVNKLQTNFGDAFNRLAKTQLFIKDVQKDKEEPTNAAIYNAATQTIWKNDRLRFIIHIADHGDRSDPTSLMLEELKKANIFYIPIAVKGEGIIEASNKFVRQSETIYRKHLADNGKSMALKPIVTYKKNIPPFEAISRALVGALNVGTDAQAGIYGSNSEQGGENSNDDFGFAALTEVAGDIFSSGGTDGSLETIAANGFIETAELGEKEQNWDYFVTLSSQELLMLNRSMETVCRAIGGSNDQKVIEDSIREMIEALTGDKLTEQEAREYWQNRETIPLVTKTLLGDGMIKFMKDYTNPDKLSLYQKRFCRGFELTGLIQANKKVPDPYDGGSLSWSGDYYVSKDAVEHNWLYKDFFKRGYYYVPLTYLPGWEVQTN